MDFINDSVHNRSPHCTQVYTSVLLSLEIPRKSNYVKLVNGLIRYSTKTFMYEDNIGNLALVYLICVVLATGSGYDIHITHRVALAVAIQNSRIQSRDCI